MAAKPKKDRLCMSRSPKNGDCDQRATHQVPHYFSVAHKNHQDYLLCEKHAAEWNARPFQSEKAVKV